jgi:Leucine-rich repeat (LRR) protein
MNRFKIFSKALLLLLVTMLTFAATSCSDDETGGWDGTYGYVQFKLSKKVSSRATRAAALDKLEKLDDAKKIKVVMEHNGTTVSQTLVLNSYNAENAEYGLSSEKLQLASGTYTIIGFYLYDAVDEELLASSAGETFTVVGGGMTVQDLTVQTVERGKVKFNLVKEWEKTRAANQEYLFSNIRLVDISVTNLFTRETVTFPNVKVTYEEDSKENQNPDNADDKYMDIGKAYCDSTVWLPAGTYQVTSYTTYGKTGAVKTKYETQPVKGEAFIVEDNQLNDKAQVPILLSKTKEYIKDYEALKAIWESLDGKDWSFYGDATFHGANWNFNKELDMWGDQPGVTLNSNGRVIGLVIAGFGAKGIVPDAIGQLTELQVLNLGSHDEKIGANIFTDYDANILTAAKKQSMRHDYETKFLKYDPRIHMSEMIIESVNSDKNLKHGMTRIQKDSRVNLKDAQIGTMTNQITGVSKAIYRLTKLQQFYIGNSPVTSGEVCAKFYNEGDAVYGQFAQEFKEEDWDNMTNLTDIELYNCPKISRIPDFYYNLPNLQAMNLARCKGISAAQLRDDWERLATEKTGKTLQILYLSYNNLEEFPDTWALSRMTNLGLLDLAYNKIKKVHPFGKEITLSSLYLNNNQIEEIPADLCGFTDDVETLTFAHNKLKKIPNIFDASSVRVMGSVDFSYNDITGVDTSNGTYKGINASTVSLSNNKIEKFPSELFAAGSPITSIDLSGNQMRTIPKGSIKGKNAYLLQVIDLRFNKLTSLSDDFRSTTLPYITNMDVSYNCFSEVPTQPLNSANLRAFAINHQRDANENRCLRTWPTGITSCPSLIQFQIGSNDIRKVEEKLTYHLYIVNIKDNPNISIDVTSVCPYIKAGAYRLFYDKTQDIRGCDALDLEN